MLLPPLIFRISGSYTAAQGAGGLVINMPSGDTLMNIWAAKWYWAAY